MQTGEGIAGTPIARLWREDLHLASFFSLVVYTRVLILERGF